MPCIKSKVNVSVSMEQEIKLKEKLGEAITILPGKSESWLMLSFEEQCHMYFKGNSQSPMAFIEVQIFGKASKQDYDKLTAEITSVFHDILKIAPDCIYVKYEEISYWGWNGANF